MGEKEDVLELKALAKLIQEHCQAHDYETCKECEFNSGTNFRTCIFFDKLPDEWNLED